MPTIYELVSLTEDTWGDHGGYPIESCLGLYSSEEKAEEAWERFKKAHPDEVQNVESPYTNRIGYEILKLVADDHDLF